MIKTNLLTSILFAAVIAIPAALVANPAHAQSGDQMTQMLARADTNRDGAVTWGEFSAVRTQMFAKMDRNSDGYVDKKDRPQIMASRFDQAYSALAKSDANRDGRISRAEVQSGPAPAFEAADADNNRVLSAKEIGAAR